MECSFKWQEYLSRLEYEQKRSWDVASHTQEIWKIDEENMDVDDAVPVTLSKRNLSLPDGYVDVCGLELSSRCFNITYSCAFSMGYFKIFDLLA